MRKLLTFFIVCFVLQIDAQQYVDIAIENYLNGNKKEKNNELIFSDFTTNDYLTVLNKSIQILDTTDQEEIKINFTNIISAIAKDVQIKFKNKSILINEKEGFQLFETFKTQQYYLTLPKVTKFSKLMYYLCSGDYDYVSHRLYQSRYFAPLIIIVTIYILFLLAILFNILHWQFRKKFIKLNILVFCLIVILSIIFKFTCEFNVSEYSFYGFSI